MNINLHTRKPLTQPALQAMLQEWPGTAVLYGTQTVLAPDPANSPRDRAVMLAYYAYSLTDEQIALLPKPDPIPDGAIA